MTTVDDVSTQTSDSSIDPTDAKAFRKVLGNMPTGVVAVTTLAQRGTPAGMTVGSFGSVSLDPPLVAFYASRSSSTWSMVRAHGSFVVNVLAADQADVARALASGGHDRFEAVAWRPSGSGTPMIEDAIAWLDCDVHAVHEAGDHDIVIGRVRALSQGRPDAALLFFRGDLRGVPL